jgi:hypothetical protein
MSKLLERYASICNIDEKSQRLVHALVESIPKDKKDTYDKVIQINGELEKKGFTYNNNSYRLGDIINSKSANCLGKPLLIGSILDSQGLPFKYELVINIKDAVFEQEQYFIKEIIDKISYNNPSLLTSNASNAIYRFCPLEHLRIKTPDGRSIETTTLDKFVVDQESSRVISNDAALSLLCKDLAIDAITDENYLGAENYINHAIDLWSDNREAHPVKSILALMKFDDNAYVEAIKNYTRIGGDDSLFHFNRFIDDNNMQDLNTALKKYPSYANAIAMRASHLLNKDADESKFLYAVASHLYGNSCELSLDTLYINHAPNLVKLYPRENIINALEQFKKTSFGDFDYHIALFSLKGDEKNLFEAESAVQTPLQQLRYMQAIKSTKYFNEKEFLKLCKTYDNSELFHTILEE